MDTLTQLRAGDQAAWTRFVSAQRPRLDAVARGYRLQPADCDEAVQSALVALFAHAGRIRDPGAVEGWLVVTLRRECLRLLQRAVREDVCQDAGADVADVATPEAIVLQRATGDAVRDAVTELPGRQRAVLQLLLDEPELPHQTAAARLGMPVGSVGPTRARALERLARDRRVRHLRVAA